VPSTVGFAPHTSAAVTVEASLPTGIGLQSRIEAGNAAVIGDATYLHQLVMNLCTNVMQAMEMGGLLNVVLGRGPYVRLFDPFFTTKENGATKCCANPRATTIWQRRWTVS
jgi:signal transduction histidine kinase